MTKLSDLKGKVFGKLTALKIDNKKKKRIYWICKCECGKKKSVASCHLTMGRISHCGCVKRKAHNFIDLTGKIFGKLTVVKISNTYHLKTKDNPVRFLCKCECGNECIVRSSDLRNGCALSCGCLRESYIASELKRYCEKEYDSVSEYRIIRNKRTKKYMPFDIYIPSFNLFVEVHGQQHYYVGGWTKLKAKLEKRTPKEILLLQKERDKDKKEYALKNGYYLEINLVKIKTIKEALKILKSKIKEIKRGNK